MLIEIVTFELLADADESAFLAADARVQGGFSHLQPGIVRRTTARGSDGGWLVLQFWGSEADADRAAERADDDPAAQVFASFVDGETLRVVRFTTLD